MNCTVCKVRLTSKNRASVVCGTIPGSYDDLCVRCYEEDDQEWVPDVALVDTGRRNMSHATCDHARVRPRHALAVVARSRPCATTQVCDRVLA